MNHVLPQLRNLCLFVLFMTLGGCGVLDKKINNSYPEKNTWDLQTDAVNDGIRDIETSDRYYGLLTVKDDLFGERIEKALVAQVDGITAVDLRFGKQEIIADIGFSHTFKLDENNHRETVKLTGTAVVHAVPSTNGNTLVIHPFFRQIKIKHSNYVGMTVPPVFLDIVNKALDRYIKNINGVLDTTEVALNAQLVEEIDPIDFAPKATGGVSTVTSPFTLNTFLTNPVVIIDTTGIKLMFGAVHDESESFNRSLEAIGTKKPDRKAVSTVASYCTQIKGVTAAMTGVVVAEGKGAVDAEMYEKCKEALRVDGIYRAEEEKRQAAAVSAATVSNDEFDTNFAEYRSKFKDRQYQDVINFDTQKSSFFVSKEFIAETVNQIASTASFSFKYPVEARSAPFDEEIKLDPAPDLNCGGIVVPCNQPNCSRRCNFSCSSKRSCNYGCKWYQLGCHGRKFDCERLKFQENLACEVKTGACNTGCAAERVTKWAACKSEEAAKIVGCEINQAWLNLVGGAKIGRVRGDAELHNAFVELHYGHQPGAFLSVNNDLTQAKLKVGLVGYGRSKVDIKYTPLDFGHAICISQWSGSIRSNFYGVMNNPAGITGAISANQVDDKVVLNIATSPQTFNIQLGESPLDALFRQNPHVAVACAPLAVLGATASIATKLEPVILGSSDLYDLQTRFEFTVDGFNIPSVLQPIEMETRIEGDGSGPDVIKLAPVWDDNTTAIGYIVK